MYQMGNIKKRLLLVALLPLLIMSCSDKGSQEDANPSNREMVIGDWKLREINNGVEYFVTFLEDGRMIQQFKDFNGGQRQYPGEWKVDGDTLFISERQGAYPLTFTEINDSTMIVMRTDSVDVIFDRMKPQE